MANHVQFFLVEVPRPYDSADYILRAARMDVAEALDDRGLAWSVGGVLTSQGRLIDGVGDLPDHRWYKAVTAEEHQASRWSVSANLLYEEGLALLGLQEGLASEAIPQALVLSLAGEMTRLARVARKRRSFDGDLVGLKAAIERVEALEDVRQYPFALWREEMPDWDWFDLRAWETQGSVSKRNTALAAVVIYE